MRGCHQFRQTGRIHTIPMLDGGWVMLVVGDFDSQQVAGVEKNGFHVPL
jgi:hypothetical protein